MSEANRKLTIFVHRASEHLTDHESHGDGLICFSILHGLAQRGHMIYAFTNRESIKEQNENLIVKVQPTKSLANSLIPHEMGRLADQWFDELRATHRIDLVWRMHPYGIGCPSPPKTGGLPLVVGPLFYSWPQTDSLQGRPRLGVGLGSIIKPLSIRGWNRTLANADQIYCATEQQTMKTASSYINSTVSTLPVIVDVPEEYRKLRPIRTVPELKLVFIANLVQNKHPKLFCEIVSELNTRGYKATGAILGDGAMRSELEAYCQKNSITDLISFEGKVPNTDVFKYLLNSDMLVSCSLGEPYGRSIVEAMAVGTPCICHKSGGPADIIDHEVNGILVDSLDAKSYVNEIEKIVTMPSKWDRLSQSALNSAQEWTSESVISGLEADLWRTVKQAVQSTKACRA